jgi:hypothetical protein
VESRQQTTEQRIRHDDVDPAKTLPDPADTQSILSAKIRVASSPPPTQLSEQSPSVAPASTATAPQSAFPSALQGIKMSLIDLKLDYAQLSSDTVVQIAGYYSHIGVVSHRSDKLFDTEPIYRMIDQLDRNTKKEVLTKCDDLQSRCAVVVQAEKDCRITILNKKSEGLSLIVEKLFIYKQVPIMG